MIVCMLSDWKPGLALKRSKTTPECKYYASVDKAGNVAVHGKDDCSVASDAEAYDEFQRVVVRRRLRVPTTRVSSGREI